MPKKIELSQFDTIEEAEQKLVDVVEGFTGEAAEATTLGSSGLARKIESGNEKMVARWGGGSVDIKVNSVSRPLREKIRSLEGGNVKPQEPSREVESEEVVDEDEVVVFPDRSIRFTPPKTKEEAGYKRPGNKDVERWDCRDCAHYIEGGGCHLVEGRIDPEANCNEYYADVGVFGRLASTKAKTLISGDKFKTDWSVDDILEFTAEVENKLTDILSGSDTSMDSSQIPGWSAVVEGKAWINDSNRTQIALMQTDGGRWEVTGENSSLFVEDTEEEARQRAFQWMRDNQSPSGMV